MKKWLVFAGLKIVEIAALVFVPLYVGVRAEPEGSVLLQWFSGLALTLAFGFIVAMSIGFVWCAIPDWIKANKRWAERICGESGEREDDI